LRGYSEYCDISSFPISMMRHVNTHRHTCFFRFGESFELWLEVQILQKSKPVVRVMKSGRL
jgi:hypothetical protein